MSCFDATRLHLMSGMFGIDCLLPRLGGNVDAPKGRNMSRQRRCPEGAQHASPGQRPGRATPMPRRGATCQPRATPWEERIIRGGALKGRNNRMADRLFRPFRAMACGVGPPGPRALPWAGMLQPLRGVGGCRVPDPRSCSRSLGDIVAHKSRKTCFNSSSAPRCCMANPLPTRRNWLICWARQPTMLAQPPCCNCWLLRYLKLEGRPCLHATAATFATVPTVPGPALAAAVPAKCSPAICQSVCVPGSRWGTALPAVLSAAEPP